MKKLIFLLIAVSLCGCSQNKAAAVTEPTAVTSPTSVSEAVTTTVSSEMTASAPETSTETTTVTTITQTAVATTEVTTENTTEATTEAVETTASEIISITEAVETTLATAPVTEVPAEIKYEKVGYGDFLKYREVFKKPEDETNPTGGYPKYINVDSIIYHDRSRIPSRDIDINDEWFNENIKPCFSDGVVTKEKLFALEIIGEGSGEYDVIPLEDFRTYRVYSTYRYLSDDIIVSNEEGETGFTIWVRHEYFTELCRVARLLWEVSMEYEISEVTQLTYMFTEKPDALEINAPVEYREQIEGYLEENNVSKEIYIFTEAQE